MLPTGVEALLDAATMRAVDRWAIEQAGVPELDLMERAGAALARVVEEVAPTGSIAIVCGRGNNGGDGLVAARLLRDAGRDVAVLAAADLAQSTPSAQANLDRLPGPPPQPFSAAALGGRAAVVDALLGTGAVGDPRSEAAAVIDAINAAGAPVVSADVPSGVDASTGTVGTTAIRAVATVAFHAAKPGLWIDPGKTHSGAVHVADIGIPREARHDSSIGLIGPGVLAALPRRAAATTKFSAGHVLVAGGSRGLTGAPCLAAMAAARAGAGYVTACVPAGLEPIFEGRLLEVMTRALPDAEGALLPEGVEIVVELAERGGALVLGPGIGRGDGAFTFARELAARAPCTLVLDADGLNAHAGRLEALARREAPTILTPHAGELGRLLDRPSAAIEAARLDSAREAATRAGAVVLLKGDDTIVADSDGRVAISPGGSPALATAGTGDVLGGVIAALAAGAAEGDPLAAAAAGVWMHAEAGRAAARHVGSAEGVIASDVIAALPRARAVG